MTKKDIFNFHHIDSNIDEEKLKQIKDLYAYYHKITWIYRQSHFRNEKINYAVNTLSVLLTIVRIITGGITLNPIILRTLTTAGILLKSYHELKNIKRKTDLLKFSVTSYEKVLTNLREVMRGGEWNYKEFIHDMKILDQEILDLSTPSSKFEKNTLKNLHPVSKVYFKQEGFPAEILRITHPNDGIFLRPVNIILN